MQGCQSGGQVVVCSSTVRKMGKNNHLATTLASLHWFLGVLCALLEWPCWALPSSSPLVACHTSPNVAFSSIFALSPAEQACTTFVPPARACSPSVPCPSANFLFCTTFGTPYMFHSSPMDSILSDWALSPIIPITTHLLAFVPFLVHPPTICQLHPHPPTHLTTPSGL